MPKTRKPRDKRTQAESPKSGERTILIQDNKASIARAAKAAYERFVREAGFEHDSRIKEWKNLDGLHQRRWVAIARAVIQASRSEDRSGSTSGLQLNDDGPRRLRPSNDQAETQKSRDRNRSARLN